MRTRILLGVLSLFAAAAYWFSQRAPVAAPPAVAVRPAPPRAAAPAPALLTPEEALAQFRSRYHLSPDRRFLSAVAAVDGFAAAGPQPPVTAHFQDGVWVVTAGSIEEGRLPAYPDFGDALTLLRTHAAARLAGLHAVAGTVTPADQAATRFDENTLLTTLTAINKGYEPGEIPVGDLTAAAQAAVRLAYFDVDKTGATDGLDARALALVVLAETAGGKLMPKEEGLLASIMGYSAAAERAAQALPAEDPWRLYLQKDDDGLERLARSDRQAGEAAYLWLRRLAELDRKLDWVGWYRQRFEHTAAGAELNVVDTQMALEGQDTEKPGSQVLAMAAVAGVHGVAPALTLTEQLPLFPGKVIGDFEQGLKGMQGSMSGPYFTADDFASYYRGYFYTAVYEWCIYLLDEWGRIDNAKDFHTKLGDAPGEAARELYVWYGDKIASEQNGIGSQQLLRDVSGLQVLGTPVYSEAVEATFARLTVGSPEVRSAADRFGALYDTRSSLRYAYVNLLYYARDLSGMNDIYASLVSQESDDNSYAKLSQEAYYDDSADLLRQAADPRLNADVRRTALDWLPDPSAHVDAVRAAYDGLIRQYPTKGVVYEDYLKFLQMQKDYDAMMRVARIWLVSQPRDKSIFDYWKATDALADAQLKNGDAKQAWTTLAPSLFDGGDPPVVPSSTMHTSGFGAAMSEGVIISLAMNQKGMAEAIAQEEADTYSDSLSSQRGLLRVWWSEGRDAEAAARIAAWKQPIAPRQWYRLIGKTFDETLGNDPIRAGQALMAMRQAHLPVNGLYSMIMAVDWSGHPDVALAMTELMFPKGVAAVADLSWGYGIVKKDKGQAAAEAWLMPKLPAVGLDEQSLYFYDNSQYELLWDVIPDPGKTSSPDELWLLRASGSVQGGSLTPEQLQSLKAYLAQGGQRWYPTLGRYVMGDDDGKSFLDKPLPTRALSEASYYLALHAAATGDYAAAVDWLNVDLDTGDTRNGEFVWGNNLLSNWAAYKQSLAVLAKQGKLYTEYVNTSKDDAD